jgi:type III restriction enzyme
VRDVAESIDNPILNFPYEPPERHFVVGPHGPTGEIKVGRRPSESFIPIAAARKGKKVAGGGTQQTIDFDLTGERREKNSLINELRREVDLWRQRSYHGTTPTTRKLLEHWADPSREDARPPTARAGTGTSTSASSWSRPTTSRTWSASGL